MRACEACGAGGPDGMAFCGQCGARLGAGLSAQTANALRRSERKVVTVLFADIKGSLALVAGQDPELAGEILGIVTACMSEAVRRHGGLVNQVMGDGIMALFGAPIAMEDHATQACLAALAMRLAIQNQVRPRVHVRVGLGSGEVVVRAVPGDVGLHYSAAGEAVHLASRMEQAAEPDQVLLTGPTRRLAGELIEVRTLDNVAIKGLDATTPVFELLRIRPARVGFGPDLARSARLVGREREMDLLRTARDRAAGGEGQAIRLVGDAGAGKSRLMREFATLHLPPEWQFCHAEAVPHRRTSYGVVSELLVRLFGLAADDPGSVRRDKVSTVLDLAEDSANEAMAPLSALLGLNVEAPGWAALDGWERRERTIGATVQAFQHLSRMRPLAVVVEDAHWLDAESLTSIQRLGPSASGRRLLTIVTERSGQATDAAAWGEAHWHDCPIMPLDEAGTIAFLRTRLLPGPDVASLERKLIEHTSGNPLFLEECLRALSETGELVRDGELFRLLAPVSALRVPASLRGLLDARVDRLEETEKDVLQAAAVVGSVVSLDLLRGAAGLDDTSLHRTLGRLVEAGFLVEGDSGLTSYAFRHGLIRESAYSGILKRSRVRMHGAVLNALERRPGPTGPIVDLLANHAVQAETWSKAVGYAQQAATRAYDRYANPEAVHYFDLGLQAASHLQDGEPRDAALLGLHLGVRSPLFRLGNVATLGPHLDEAVRLAANQPGHVGLAQAHIMRSHVHWLRGDPVGALADAGAAEELALAHDDADLRVRARFQRGLVSLSQSDVPGTLANMVVVIAHMDSDRAPRQYGVDIHLVVNALSYSARAHAAAGDLVAARACCDGALGLAASLDQRQTKIYAHLADSAVALAEGRPARALEASTEADDLCRRADVRLLSPVAAGFLAQAHVASGRAGQALPIARQAVRDAERMGFMAMQAQRLSILAETLLALDQVAEALDTAQAAVALAQRMGEGGAEAAALGLVAEALIRLDRESEAAEAIAEALTIAQRLGLAPLVLHLSVAAGGRRASPVVSLVGVPG
jgi:class 3 adenylate cyclase/tetratricopeptide (TPR) repeat protein